MMCACTLNVYGAFERPVGPEMSLLVDVCQSILQLKATYKCITTCDIDLRRELFKSVVLSGGTTMFPGNSIQTVMWQAEGQNDRKCCNTGIHLTRLKKAVS